MSLCLYVFLIISLWLFFFCLLVCFVTCWFVYFYFLILLYFMIFDVFILMREKKEGGRSGEDLGEVGRENILHEKL